MSAAVAPVFVPYSLGARAGRLVRAGISLALHLQGIRELRNFQELVHSGHYVRLYFGNEFCPFHLPRPEDVEEVVAAAGGLGIGFTLVTPPVNDRELARVGILLNLLSKIAPAAEVVANDWGVLSWLSRRHPGLRPVMGRLLVHQRSGPRIMELAGTHPAAVKRARHTVLEVPALLEFMAEMAVGRAELDHPLQGIDHHPVPGSPALSLYHPYTYVSTTRNCPWPAAGRECNPAADTPDGRSGPAAAGDKPAAIDREPDWGGFCPTCKAGTVRYRLAKTTQELILAGNAVFFLNPRLPRNLCRLGIDRVVHQPSPPF